MADVWLAVAQSKDIEQGKTLAVDVNGQSLLICHTEEGFFAIENQCTHDELPLDGGELDGCELECPYHGARFDVRDGQARCLPAVTGVKHFPVRVEGEVIQVQLD